jgi:hypothetical protein
MFSLCSASASLQAPSLPAELVARILWFLDPDAHFVARVAGLSRSWKEAVGFLKQLDVRLEETWWRQKGISSLIIQTERLQILDIEFTSSKAEVEDMALQSGAVKSAAAVHPQILTTWLRHTKSSLTSLAVAVTSARQPVHSASSLAEAIILHIRKSSCLQKLWLWQLELDVPSF